MSWVTEEKMVRLLLLMLVPAVATGGLLWAGGEAEKGDQFTYGDVERIRVDGRYFDVDFEGVSGNGLEAVVYRSYPDEDVFHEMRGNEVRIWVPKKPRWGRLNRGSRLVLRVPEDAEIDVETSSGDIRFRIVSILAAREAN